MRVNFVQRENQPERLVCEAEVMFEEEGPLVGMKLVGFSLWRSPEGEVYVTFPSRAFGAGNERRYFDYLRSTDGAAGRQAGESLDPGRVPGCASRGLTRP
jgi:hypothetical protein